MVQYNLLPLKKWHTKRVSGAGQLAVHPALPLGTITASFQGLRWCTQCRLQLTGSARSSKARGLHGEQSGASLSPSQTRDGCRECLWEACYQTTQISSTPLKPTGWEDGVQAKWSWATSALHPRKKHGAHDTDGRGGCCLPGSLALILIKENQTISDWMKR